MSVELKLQIRQKGALIHAKVAGRDDMTIASIATACCEADREVFEDFQALAIKALGVLVKNAGAGELESFHFQAPPGAPR